MDQPANSSAPTIKTCLRLLNRYAILSNIREHSFIVARVAETLNKTLATYLPNENLPDPDILIAGALLHDIAKSRCIKSGCDHVREGVRICLEHGYPEIAKIVGEHTRLTDVDEKRWQDGTFLAEELVFYADKRVLHTSIVDLDMRLPYILKRYGNNDPIRHQRINATFAVCRTLEKWICHHTGRSPSKLLQEVADEPFT